MAEAPKKEKSGRRVKGSPKGPITKIKDDSMDHPQKVVIDEIFDGGSMRIIVQEMKEGFDCEQYLDDDAWGGYRSEYIEMSDLGGLLTREQHNEVREGRVFLITKRESHDVYQKFRKKAKELTKQLLKKEGFKGTEVKRKMKRSKPGGD